jgi:uncharacterized Zn finger protein
MSSELEEKPEKIARPGLFCHSCGEKGKIFEFPETVATSEGELDLPLFRCENCGAKWYDAADVVALVVIYRLEFTKKP